LFWFGLLLMLPLGWLSFLSRTLPFGSADYFLLGDSDEFLWTFSSCLGFYV
jgi:hypothetical protein